MVKTATGSFHVHLTAPALAVAVKAAKGKRIGETHFRTRGVTAGERADGSECLRCTCGYYQRTLIACRHIFAIKNGAFELHEDIHPQYLQIYGTAHGDGLPKLVQGAGTTTGPGRAGFDPSTLPVVDEAAVPATTTVAGLQDVPDEDDEPELSPDERDAMGKRVRLQGMHAEATRIWNAAGKCVIEVFARRTPAPCACTSRPCAPRNARTHSGDVHTDALKPYGSVSPRRANDHQIRKPNAGRAASATYPRQCMPGRVDP